MVLNKKVERVSTASASTDFNFCDEYSLDNMKKKASRRVTTTSELSASIGWCRLCEVKLPYWNPEDETQWRDEGGKHIAYRNLLVSMPNLFCGFGVWLVWSAIVPKIQLMHDADPTLYPFQDWGSPTGENYRILLYSLPAVAGLSGGTMRLANSFLTQIVGGRNVVAHSSVMLLFSMIITAITLKHKNAPFTALLIAAWLSGVGGGAFASSMSNMSFLYPKAEQGYCLGMNGGLGNLGVSCSQLLVPLFMSISFGKAPLSQYVDGWPNHAGWFWWPICFVCAIMAFVWMNNLPEHGNHPGRNDALWNIIYYYWFEVVGLGAASLAIILLVYTREVPVFIDSPRGELGHKFLLVVIAMILEHIALVFLSPSSVRECLKEQAQIFRDKHTYVMTVLYTMCFGSFIGFSGAFPKLIQDLFGYIVLEGCHYEDVTGTIFVEDGTEHDCVADGGSWGTETITNPAAPDVFSYAWLGPCVGSLIRPVGGIMADKHGGAKMTQLLIIWCFISTIILGILVQVTQKLKHPENNFGLFVFFYLNVFFCVGALNGTTFRTIGVLFDRKLAGPVLGWSSAVASYGAFVIPSMFAVSIKAGAPEMTLYYLGSFYFLCGCLNYWYYGRPGTDKPGV